MKKIIFATGALLLGTSALAWAPSTQPAAPGVKAPLAAKAPLAGPGVKAAATALVAKSNDLPKAEPVALADESLAPEAEPASASWIADDGLAPKDDSAAKEIDTSQGDPDLDLTEQPAPLETAAATGPQPAAGNYPACRPGPGDDNCIQLYEPGVQTALASWTQPTGGLASDTQMASAEGDTTLAAEMGEPSAGMGGPYEPVEASDELAMYGDGYVQDDYGETAEAAF